MINEEKHDNKIMLNSCYGFCDKCRKTFEEKDTILNEDICVDCENKKRLIIDSFKHYQLIVQASTKKAYDVLKDREGMPLPEFKEGAQRLIDLVKGKLK